MKRERIQSEVNAGSMADIAFLLLIFFLVATTIDTDKGITVLLPQFENTPPTPLPENQVLSILLNHSNDVLIEGQATSMIRLTEAVMEYLMIKLQEEIQPIISLQVHRQSSYDAYIMAYNGIKAAYNELREKAAIDKYGKSYEFLPQDDRKAINKSIPMIISEADPFEFG